MKVKEESEKAGSKLNIQITSWQIDGETMETVTDFLFLGSRITADGDCSHEIKRRSLVFPSAPALSTCLGRPRGMGWDGEGGGRGHRDRETCKSMTYSCQCMAKTTTVL